MLRTALSCLGCAALLAACAPSLTAPTLGRIVNAKTGQEGVVTFLPGALWSGGTTTDNNVTVQIGNQTYLGRAVLLDAAVVPARPAFDLSFGLGASQWDGIAGWGWGTRLGTPPAPRTVLRTGNLIAKTTGATPLTLTCTLQVDASEHGIGDCTGSDGARYALQF
ncbi:hypothetical protein Dgeo_0885 [Deinococcus geothermalis DSM 11300]|uniref:Lipoprotein n=1 Tax=Deinococcus geothermalis (strain DSM 11300 / CIP 105573 / AG-3a) TaxID=319795 RepID=Q1IZZ7_DEIGD|nr:MULTISPECIES: hypothetical protein [Deinococcus]ABF45187.1 hypothetical protein Dgeo_0885 [Deinococcus geothermalis DSM 11300]MBI0444469.1 hypothetical protein [Deinococcus sp. DB0503]